MKRVLALTLAAALLALAGCAGRQKPAPVDDRSIGRPTVSRAAPPAVPSSSVARPEPVEPDFYVVKRGDTLYSIALEHGADYRDVAQWNSLADPTKINVGQQLRVKPPEGRAPVYETTPRVEIGATHGPGAIESRPIDAGPRAEAKAAPKPEAAEAKALEAPVDFIWPAKGRVLAGFAEPRSKGIDIEGKIGDSVVAAAAGRVTYIGTGIPGLGKLVVIKHDNGFITVYAHNKDIVVKEQQNVTRGQRIAVLGNTDADRPKLHFQIRKGSAPVDPMRYLPAPSGT